MRREHELFTNPDAIDRAVDFERRCECWYFERNRITASDFTTWWNGENSDGDDTYLAILRCPRCRLYHWMGSDDVIYKVKPDYANRSANRTIAGQRGEA